MWNDGRKVLAIVLLLSAIMHRKDLHFYAIFAGGREPGRTGGGRGTGDGRRKGGKRDLYDGGKQERNSERQAFVICYCLQPVKETNPTTFLDFHLTFSEA